MSLHPFFERGGRPEQSRQRILLISYHFPPDATIGARRWERLAAYVAERGWGLDVVTCAEPTAPDLARMEELPEGIRVFGVPSVKLRMERMEDLAARAYRVLRDGGRGRRADGDPLAAQGAAPSIDSGWLDRSQVRWNLHTPRGFMRAYWAWLYYARFRAWSRRVARLCEAIGEKGRHFAVVTSGPPHATYAAGYTVAENLGLPFVMDMRDAWSLSGWVPEGFASPLWFQLARRHESIAVRKAALVVANTEAARDALGATHPGGRERMIAVMNGSDDLPIPPSSAGHRFTIGYAGTIYATRHPRSLFRAAAIVIRDLGLSPADFGIEFVGSGSLEVLAREEGVADFVATAPARPHAQALEFLAQSAMLAIFPGGDPITIPAKAFECVLFDAWLLVLCAPGSATHRLFHGIRADVVEPDDVIRMAAAIRRRYEEYRQGVRPVRAVSDGRFSRSTQARTLLDAMERFLPRGVPR